MQRDAESAATNGSTFSGLDGWRWPIARGSGRRNAPYRRRAFFHDVRNVRAQVREVLCWGRSDEL